MPMDEVAVRGMVEDNWRLFIPLAFNGNQSEAKLVLERFDARIQDMASLMTEPDAVQFLEIADVASADLFAEYNASPEKLKQRLGISTAAFAGAHGLMHSKRMGLGEVAVRTAVRATIWESVIGIFRALR